MRMRTAGTVFVLSLALVSCGDDDSSSTSAAPVTTTEASVTATTSIAATTVAPADAASGGASAPPEATDGSASSAPATPAATAGANGCSVSITGDVTAEWTSTISGPQAFVYGGWLTSPSAEDAEAFGLNCYDQDFNIVGFFAPSGVTVPMEPVSYEAVGTPGATNVIPADVALLFDDGLWEATGGTLEIVEFDDSHISGSFSLTIEDSSTSRTAQVTGEFTHSR